jgi:hypothetical protein
LKSRQDESAATVLKPTACQEHRKQVHVNKAEQKHAELKVRICSTQTVSYAIIKLFHLPSSKSSDCHRNLTVQEKLWEWKYVTIFIEAFHHPIKTLTWLLCHAHKVAFTCPSINAVISFD